MHEYDRYFAYLCKFSTIALLYFPIHNVGMKQMSQANKLSPERYLANKEYFDKSLIECLERLTKKNEDLKFSLDAYKVVNADLRQKNRNLKFKLDDTNRKLMNLSKKSNVNNQEIDELHKIIQDINRKVDEDITIRDEIIDEKQNENEKLQKKIEELEKKLRRYEMADTTNTNNPSSTYRFCDAIKNVDDDQVNEEAAKTHKPHPVTLREKSGKKVGGQKNHKLHRSKMVDKPDEVETKWVKQIPDGAEAVYGNDGNLKYYRTQEISADFLTHIKETRYIFEEDGDDLNGEELKKYKINPVTYSSQFKALVLYMESKGSIALDRLCLMMNEMSDGKIKLSTGTVVNWKKEFEKKSEDYRKWILAMILISYVCHVDETGYKIDGTQSWIHAICTSKFAYFVMTEKRGDEENGPLRLLEEYAYNLVHDHFKKYYHLENCNHCECDVHVQRILKGGIDFDDVAGCQEMIDLLMKMLHRKHELIEQGYDKMDEDEFQEFKTQYLEICERLVTEYYDQHPNIKAKYVPLAIKALKRMKEYADEHLRFLSDFDVPYSNNAAEKQCRCPKSKKKVSGQVKNLENGQCLCAILTVNQTCMLQKKNTLRTITNILETGWPNRETLPMPTASSAPCRF